jgi:hypothetical protein
MSLQIPAAQKRRSSPWVAPPFLQLHCPVEMLKKEKIRTTTLPDNSGIIPTPYANDHPTKAFPSPLLHDKTVKKIPP